MKANEYDLSKSEDKERLRNIDVEMDGVKRNMGAEEERMLDDTDDIDMEENEAKDNQYSDDDEYTNNSDRKMTPCSMFLLYLHH